MTKNTKILYIICAVVIGVAFVLVGLLALSVTGFLDMRPKLVFTSGSAEKIYDGTPLTSGEWNLVSGSLKEGETAAAVLSAERTEAGISPNYFTVTITDGGGEDVTSGYNIEYRPGELKVAARPLTVKSQDAFNEYDGTALTCNKYDILSGDAANGQEITVSVYGTRTDAGTADNLFNVKVTDGGSDVTHNYGIEKLTGKLEVLKRSISILTPSFHKVYDGQPLIGNNEWSYASVTRILSGHEIEVQFSGSQTDAGVSKNGIDVKITENGKNMNANYDITYLEGDLIVTPLNLTVRSESAEKPYDGSALINSGWSYASSARPLPDHSVTVAVSGAQTETGSSPNALEVQISAAGRNVIFNYEITLQEGRLTVTAAEPPPPAEPQGINLNESGRIGGELTTGSGDGSGGNGIAARVYSPSAGGIYLKYMSFGGYDGAGWLPAAENTGAGITGANYFAGAALKNAGVISRPVTLEVYGNNYLLPYYLDAAALSYKIQASDVRYSGSTLSAYSAYCYMFDWLGAGVSVTGTASEAERQYYEYVISEYLSLPVGTRAYFEQIISDKGFSAGNPDVIAAVADYIRGAAVYDPLYNRALDSAPDIAVSFLSGYKAGVSSHFATAAVLLYRALGIPARYVLGYAVNARAEEWVSVTESGARAAAEVYISGIGWVQADVLPDAFRYEDAALETDGDAVRIKPVDLSMRYKNGVPLTAENRLQGLSGLVSRGYTYTSEVTGKQAVIGTGYSVITAFKLFNANGQDVTGEFDITFGKGKLHVYAIPVTVVTESLDKPYDGKPLTGGEGGCTLEGELITGHSFKALKPTGSQTEIGQSENSYGYRIVDGAGADCTYLYSVAKDFGTLTVSAREITVTAGSASKAYNGTPLTSAEYAATLAAGGEAAAEGDIITVVISGSQTEIGKSRNEVESVTIVDKNGKDVTANYSVRYVSGWLEVT